MAKIVALVDGSVYAKSVCGYASWLAIRTGSPVELLHVLGRRETHTVPSDLSGSIALGARTSLLAELSALDEQRAKLAQKRGRAVLDDAKAAVEALGVEQVTVKLRIGDLVDTVTGYESDADLIVIGKRGEAADFAKLHLGSNMERVARSSHKPVFVASRAFKPVERFMIAYDGGTSSMKAVDYVARSPIFAGLRCRLVTVGANSDETRKRLADAEAILRGAGYDVEGFISQGQPDVVLTQFVENGNIDLLVMGAYGHSRIRNLIIGSTTSEMIRSCKVPILLFR